MDIWKWVHGATSDLRRAGHDRLADLVWGLPSAVVDDEHDRVDAMVPEALALAEGLRSPWVELFVRHWNLQSRVLHRGEGKSALREAVALLEFAHRPETEKCPQSVCTVQDLCAAYGFADDTGFAPEREQVSRETLARIDETWPCWSCVGSELAEALTSQGRAAEALRVIDTCVAKALAGGDREAFWGFELSRYEALLHLGRYDEVLEVAAQGADAGRDSVHHVRERAIDAARALLRLGRTDEAAEKLPEVAAIADTPAMYDRWTEAVVALVDAGLIENGFGIGRTFAAFVPRLEEQGTWRSVVRVAERGALLAVRRGALRQARKHLAAMERAVPELHRPLDAPARVAAVRAALAAVPVLLPDSADTLLAELQGDRPDPEADLTRLDAALERWPDDPRVGLVRAAALLAAGAAAEAREALAPLVVDRAPDEVVLPYIEAVLQAGVPIGPEVLRLRAEAADPSLADWLVARAAFDGARWADAIVALAAVLAQHPGAINTRRMWARAALQLGDWQAALDRLDEVAERQPGPDVDWERLIPATILGAWDKVRESGARLGLPVEGEGPIFANWGACKVRVDGEDLWAMRTGPVSALIVEIHAPPKVSRFRDRVVFRAEPLNQPESTERPVYVYAHVATLEPGRCWAFAVDGVRPADWPALEAQLDGFGGECRVLSGDGYRLGGEAGVYAVVAVPDSVDPLGVHAALLQAAGGTPLTWLSLARRVGDGAEVARQEALVESLGL